MLASALLVSAWLALPTAPAAAGFQTVTYRQGPLAVAPYSVRYTDAETKEVPAPQLDGYHRRDARPSGGCRRASRSPLSA